MSVAEPLEFFAGVRVVDLGTGFSGALVTKLVADLGASVTRVHPTLDPFLDLSPAYRLWRSEQISQPFTTQDDLDVLLADADVCVIGGDEYPGFLWKFDVGAIAAKQERLVVLNISGTTPESSKGDMPANDLLAQARSGIVNERFSKRPICLGVHLPTYGAVLHGLIGVSAALFERELSGRGDIVSTSLVQGAAAFLGSLWFDTGGSDVMVRGVVPLDVEWQFLQCSDGRWITFHQGVAGSTAKIHRILGMTVVPGTENARWKPVSDDPTLFFGITEEMKAKARTRPSGELLEAFLEAGIAAELVRAPGECWDDDQSQENNLIRQFGSGCQGVGAPIRGTSEFL
jgi:crotonobetainyl-CoA:carnitine CoA-transferase CaiB-like acyl-CoA transferase